MPTTPRLHDWHIEEREYLRQETRRGRRHAYSTFDATRTAHIVVDMVPFFVDAGRYQQGIVPNINRIAHRLRSAGGLVAWIVPGASPRDEVTTEFLGPETAESYAKSGGSGAPRDRVWPELDTADRDIYLEKTASSAFFPGRCSLHEMLTERNIDTVLITGTVANVCCESSARDASTLGYRTIMIADANAARRDQDLNATLYTIYRTFGDVRTTDDTLAILSAK